MVDAHDSTSCVARRAGSIPASGTIKPSEILEGFLFMWTVYVLKSLKSGKRYVGMTQNLADRIAQHNTGKSKFTSGHLPWKLVHQENFETTLDARKREKYLKSAAGRRFLDAINGAGSLPD